MKISNKYVDTVAIMQVIGNVYKDPSLLDRDDKYIITEDDFPDKFHKIVFGSIYKLHELGASKITLENISDYLSNRPKSNAIYVNEKGEKWLTEVLKNVDENSFDYYYNRMKKMSLLRAYNDFGVSVTDIYDPDIILDTKLKERQEEYLDNSSLEDIANRIDKKIDAIKLKYVDSAEYGKSCQASTGIEDLLDKLNQHPEVGVPLYGPLINTVSRGARLKKFYLRSASSGLGKTRTMLADACYVSCSEIYDDNLGWIKLNSQQPTLFISTEQELEEIQTMMLAFISNVNEDHILNGKYESEEELQRIQKAVEILKKAPLYIETLPDFSLQDIENTIKRNIHEHNVLMVFHDYIHSSIKILSEIGSKSGIKLREDNILFMLSTRLKDLCNKYGIFIMSATQLNANYVDSETPDQNLLRGE